MRLISGKALLSAPLINRILAVTSISGVHDLRPLLHTELNDLLAITDDIAANESPALLTPLAPVMTGKIEVNTWVGAEERPEFCRQADLLSLSWGGLGVQVNVTHEKGRHHFDVIEGLTAFNTGLINAVLGQGGSM